MLIDFTKNNLFLTIGFYLELELGYPKWLRKSRLRLPDPNIHNLPSIFATQISGRFSNILYPDRKC